METLSIKCNNFTCNIIFYKQTNIWFEYSNEYTADNMHVKIVDGNIAAVKRVVPMVNHRTVYEIILN